MQLPTTEVAQCRWTLQRQTVQAKPPEETKKFHEFSTVENYLYTSVPFVFRTNISVNQLSIYGTVSDVCEEYSTCQTSTGRPVLAGQSDPHFEPAKLLITTPTPSIEIPAKKMY